jgi:drug/metabolite transporter (DMT)-like permease
MCAAVVLFAFMNACVKLLSKSYDPVQLVWARTFAHFVFILLVFMPQSGFAILKTARPGTQLTRSVIQVCSTACFFTALGFIPLAEAISISFLAPLIVTLLATRMLGEKISVPRLIAILVGLCGVLIVIRPGSDVFHWASLLILASTFFYANYQILTRRVASVDKPETSTFYSALVGSIVTSLAVPFFWHTPDSAFDVVLLASLGVLGGLGHYLVARALFNAPANIASPFQYFQLVVGVILGYLFFGDIPSAYTWMGSSIIVASGIYIGWSESRRS